MLKSSFILRCSQADVNIESSTFTKLPNVKRYLIRLGGDDSFSLSINNSHFKTVPVYSEPVLFTGDDNVKSIKTCQDFNIMTGGLDGLEELMITCHDFGREIENLDYWK